MAGPDALHRVTQVFDACRPKLVEYLAAAFPRLAAEAEDILQDIWLEVHRRVVDEGFCPPPHFEAWLRTLARSRAIDRLRRIERRIFQTWPGTAADDSDKSSWTPPAEQTPSPSHELAERERRQRQGLLLSQVLGEFCHWCEARPQRLAIKEAYERSLRGQSPAQIAAAMGVPARVVHQWLFQAREWVRERLSQKDIDRSVFLTLYGRA